MLKTHLHFEMSGKEDGMGFEREELGQRRGMKRRWSEERRGNYTACLSGLFYTPSCSLQAVKGPSEMRV